MRKLFIAVPLMLGLVMPGTAPVISEGAEVRLRATRHPVRVLRKERIESAVRRFLARRLESRQGDVEVNAIHIPKRKIPLPKGKAIHLVVKAPARTRFLGRVPLILSVMQGSSEIRRVWVSAEISVFTRVPVAVVPIRAKQRLSSAQFEMRRHDMASLPDNVVTSPESLDGAHAVRPLSPGEVIRKSDVRFPYLVKQGHLVRLYARRGKLVITAIGKALDAGRKGEIVRVINIDSNKPVQGRVIEQSSVEVLF